MKRNLAILLFIVFSFVAALGQGRRHAEASEWTKVAPVDGGFSVLMPGNPVESTEPVKSVAKTENHIFLFETNLAGYVFSYVEFPEAITAEPDVQRILDGGREGGLSASGGKLKSEKNIKLNQYLGREWLVDLPGGFLATSRAYWVKRRLYQLVFVVQPTAKDDEAVLSQRQNAVNKFFDSFTVAEATSQ